MPTRPECQNGGAPPQLFDAQQPLRRRAASPASSACRRRAEHLDLCNLTIKRAADVETGKRLAVALLAAAAHTCE